MTWFQLVQSEIPQSPKTVRLVPNSAFFLNPALLDRPRVEPAFVRPQLRRLRLVQ
ncbi:MAG: hypothetical protein AAF657_21770 [Acidobacteriota bacterium]